MEMHNLAAVNAAIAAIETSAELENEPVSLEAHDWPMEPLRLGSVLCLGDFVTGFLRYFHTGLKVAIAVTPRSLVYLLCF